jgi:hypothetical protein
MWESIGLNGATVRRVVATAAVGLMMVLLPGAVGPATAVVASDPVATVHTGGGPLNVRPTAATRHAEVDQLPDGARLAVDCRLAGEGITGTAGSTDNWLRIGKQRYVSAAYVRWQPKQPTLPWCEMPADPAPESPEEFIAWAAELAQDGWEEHRVPAPVTIAQAINESGWGGSALTKEGNAYFGIKCFGEPGPVAAGCRPYPTSECDERDCVPTEGVFRVYHSAADSFADHGRFLTENPRYEPAFAHTDDPDEFARQIHRAGYATAPDYADRLIALMRDYDLYRFHPSTEHTGDTT